MVSSLLRKLVQVSCRRPVLTIVLSLLLSVVSVAWTLHGLSFKTTTRALLPQDAAYVVRYTEYGKDFGELEDIVVVVEAGSFESARAYAARLSQELRSSPVKFKGITYRIDPNRFEGRELLYLSTADLAEVRDKIFDHQEFMEGFAEDPSLASLIEGVNRQMAAAFLSNLFDLGLRDSDLPVDVRFLRVLLDQVSTRLERPAPYRSPWATLFSFGADRPADAGYFLSEDKSLLFILVETPEGRKGSFVGDQESIGAIRAAIARLAPVFPNVRAGVTGAPALSNDEMSAAFRDSELATGLAFALTLLLMTLAFSRIGKPLLMLGVLAVTLTWSLGIATLVVGHLTLFSVMFIPIVIGVGIDAGNYLLYRYREEIGLGRSVSEALEITGSQAGPGMLIGALAAAGSFLILLLTDFRGVQELGFIAGLSIVLAWLGMTTFFPALLLLVDRPAAAAPPVRRPAGAPSPRLGVPLLDRLAGFPRTVLAAAAIATALSIWVASEVGFDYNVLNLQAKGTESVAWEKRILATTGRSGLNGLSSASTLEELRRKHEAFKQLPSVSEVDSVLRVIPDEQDEKIAIIKSFAPLVEPIRVGHSSPVDLERLRRAIADIKRRLDVVAAEAGAKLPAEVQAVREKAATAVSLLGRVDRDVAESALNHLQAQLYRDFVDTFHTLQRNLHPVPTTSADVPAELQRKFVGRSGRFLVQVHPGVDIWEREGAARFVRDLRSVDPEVTGPPVITYEATLLMERAYLQGTVYAFLLTGVLALLTIRRPREAALALLPLGLGLLWTVGLMHVLGLRFNLANIWGLPLIIGTSAEFGLNIVLRYMEGAARGGPLVARSTLMAVGLNGLVTMVGFGSLMIATHQGIFGLGLLLVIGAACNLVASLVVLPVTLRLIAPDEVRTPGAVLESSAA